MSKKLSTLGLAVAVAGLALLPVAVATAATEDTIINGEVGTSLTITTSGTVGIPAVTPTATGNVSVATDTVTVTTNDSAGYTLDLEMANATNANNLMNGATTLSAGDVATANTWGYSLGGTDLSDQALSALTGTFAAVPVNGSPATLKTTSAPATSGDATSVSYGLSADTSQPSGSYTNTVLYTAVTNSP